MIKQVQFFKGKIIDLKKNGYGEEKIKRIYKDGTVEKTIIKG